MAEEQERWTDLTAEEKQKILQMLKENPALVAEFIKESQDGDILAVEALKAYTLVNQAAITISGSEDVPHQVKLFDLNRPE